MGVRLSQRRQLKLEIEVEEMKLYRTIHVKTHKYDYFAKTIKGKSK